MGPGGEEVAGRLAEAGLAVAGVESRLVGGECPYFGCIPSKMMIRAANLLAETARVNGMAGQASAERSWDPVARRIRQEATDDWDDTVAADRFISKGGYLFRGTGRITRPGEVRVAREGGEDVLRVRRGMVSNTGPVPAGPPIPGLAGTPDWPNREGTNASGGPGPRVVIGRGGIRW